MITYNNMSDLDTIDKKSLLSQQSDDFTTINKKVRNIKQSTEEDLEEDDSVKYMIEQSDIETKMENLLMDIKTFTDEQCVEIGDKLNIGNLIDFFYPNMKRVF